MFPRRPYPHFNTIPLWQELLRTVEVDRETKNRKI